MQLTGAHQLLVYADDVNLLCENMNIINKTWECMNLRNTSKEVGLEMNDDKTMHILTSHHQNAVYNCSTHS
jgi:hypothetical protein